MGDCPVCGHDAWCTTYDHDDLDTDEYIVETTECLHCGYSVTERGYF
jgi:C4-type Zn-finger protein